ncbi:DUF2254 domain-containing protein [Ornithinimicrobium cryptoxanthini]|uniref:DUF2254 domain-containing protein n=1 Tax=Ornithinimicrobium cryptoxanthini TaxID=2934161 RepID=A0ABY4YII3_9MICO|nr:DUF2254 domain-containing protein [Ornithinimicrobium cryptoxanthini]USQ76569.1 DUF2254 domain-containing protein [Ornithinimicrobium cryptoxanthini]
MQLSKILSNLRSGLWFIPLVYAVGGLILNAITTTLDSRTNFQLVPIDVIGGPDAALGILGAVAASMISLVATVLSITMVVVQLAMGQFSPRIVQTFLQDRPSQHAIGLFVATFVQAMLTMRQVQVSEESPVVPGISIAVTFLLVIVNIVVLVVYIHHIGRQLRVSSLIELVGGDTRSLMDKVYPGRLEDDQALDPHLVTARTSGVLSLIGREELVAVATEADCRIDIIPAIGQFVPADGKLARLTGSTIHDVDVDLDRLRGALVLSLERSQEEDVAYGLRMLVDMGLKAMADSPNADPTTVVQVLDRVQDVLRQLSRRELRADITCDENGQERVVIPSMDWQAYVRLSFEELRLFGAGSPQVARRMRAALEDLLDYAPRDRHGPLLEQLSQLDDSVAEAYPHERDVTLARRADAQGLGVAAGAASADNATE